MKAWGDDPRDEIGTDPLRPSPWRVLAEAGSLCYDYLGMVAVGSLVVFAPALLLGAFLAAAFRGSAAALDLLGLGLLWIPASALLVGPASLAERIRTRDEPGMRHLVRGWRRHGPAAALLGAMNGGAGAVLAGDLCAVTAWPGGWLRTLAIPILALLLVWLSAQIYALPLLVRGHAPWRAFRQAHLLALANPGFSGALLVALALSAAASAVAGLPLATAFPVWAPVVASCSVEALARKYDALDARSPGKDGSCQNRSE